MRSLSDNPEFVAALVHGRRSRMREGGRLAALGQTVTAGEFTRELWGTGAPKDSCDCQRRLMEQFARELAGLTGQLSGPAASLLQWMLSWFHIQNLKVLLRARAAGLPPDAFGQVRIPLPGEPDLDWAALGRARSATEVVRLACDPALRELLTPRMRDISGSACGFVLETVLDRVYFAGALARAMALSREDRDHAIPLVCQEVDTFHLMLAVRGRFLHGLTPETLLPLHVAGTRISQSRLAGMLTAVDLRAAASLAVGRALDALPPPRTVATGVPEGMDPAGLERLAWNRFHRLANQAFRRSHMGVATVVAYVALRRIEVANLITLCEGFRLGAAPDEVRSHLVPTAGEAGHV